jgi:hypothetical protein
MLGRRSAIFVGTLLLLVVWSLSAITMGLESSRRLSQIKSWYSGKLIMVAQSMN